MAQHVHEEDNNLRWQNKYLDLFERHEVNQKQLNDTIELLRRHLVRICLVAEGKNPQLNRQLAELRRVLRRKNFTDDLEVMMTEIEVGSHQFDDDHRHRKDQLQQLIIDVERQLNKLDIPKPMKREFHSYRKRLKSQIHQLHAFPALFLEYARFHYQFLLKSNANALVRENPALPSPPSVESVHPEKTPTPGFLGALKRFFIPDIRIHDTPSELTFDPVEEEDEVPVGVAENHEKAVRDRLRGLIGKLCVPQSLRVHVQQVLEGLETTRGWEGVVKSIDEVSYITTSSLGSERKEVEFFLESLNDRLYELSQAIVENQSSNQQASRQILQVNNSVRSQVEGMQRLLQQSTEVDDLKSAVKRQLDLITSAMNQQSEIEAQRSTLLERQLQVLNRRIGKLESETRSVRVNAGYKRYEVLVDELTQLPNLDAYRDRILLEYNRWRRYRGNLTVVVGDVDHFRQINDEYGFEFGDDILKILASQMSQALRETDFIARYGGEEFVMIMPQTKLFEAQQAIEKIRQMIERYPFEHNNAPVKITMSFGIAEFESDDSPDSIYQRAGESLYQAKKAGRNCIQANTDMG